MKKIFSFLAFAAAMFAVSCSQVEKDFPTAIEGEEVIVSFTAALPEIATRAEYSDGTTATTLNWAVYPEGEKTVLLSGTKSINLTTTVDVKLVAGKSYDVLFWAADATNKAYALDLATQTMTVTYANLTANNESNDAFYAFESRLQVKGAINKEIKLKRPFAQINLGTDDYVAARTANLLVGKTGMSAKLANVLNFADGSVEGAETVRIIPAGTAPCAGTTPVVNIDDPKQDKEKFPVDGYQYLQMNYVLVGADKSIIDCTFYVHDATTNNAMDPAIVVANVPVQRNYRTNIYGSLLTQPALFNVTIEPEYTEPDYDVPASVGTLIAAGQNGGNVALTEDVQLDQELVVAENKVMNIDLNGNDITAAAEVTTKAAEDIVVAIRVKGELTISGNGTVYGGAGNAANYAILVEEGGKLTINGGTYTTGADKDGLGNATIETKGGDIIINDGHFSTAKAYNNVYFVLNKRDNTSGSITVYGGTFVNYDPALSHTENPADTFVAEGYESVYDEATSSYVVGLKKEGATAKVASAADLLKALTTFTSEGAGSNTIVLSEDIILAEGETWEPILLSSYQNTGTLVIDGMDENGVCHSISGLDYPLFDGSNGGSKSVVIKNLTIKDSKMLTMKNLSNSMNSNGILMGGLDVFSGKITLENVHAERCVVKSPEFCGLIGYISAQDTAENTFTNCSVTDCDFEGQNVAGILSMCSAGEGVKTTISNCKAVNCRFNNVSLDKGEKEYGRYDKVACIVSTINTGINVYSNVNENTGNTYTIHGENGGSLYWAVGRFTGGSYSLDGTDQTQFNMMNIVNK